MSDGLKYVEVYLQDIVFQDLTPEEEKKFYRILRYLIHTLRDEEVSLFHFKNVIAKFITNWYEQNAILKDRPEDGKE